MSALAPVDRCSSESDSKQRASRKAAPAAMCLTLLPSTDRAKHCCRSSDASPRSVRLTKMRSGFPKNISAAMPRLIILLMALIMCANATKGNPLTYFKKFGSWMVKNSFGRYNRDATMKKFGIDSLRDYNNMSAEQRKNKKNTQSFRKFVFSSWTGLFCMCLVVGILCALLIPGSGQNNLLGFGGNGNDSGVSLFLRISFIIPAALTLIGAMYVGTKRFNKLNGYTFDEYEQYVRTGKEKDVDSTMSWNNDKVTWLVGIVGVICVVTALSVGWMMVGDDAIGNGGKNLWLEPSFVANFSLQIVFGLSLCGGAIFKKCYFDNNDKFALEEIEPAKDEASQTTELLQSTGDEGPKERRRLLMEDILDRIQAHRA